MQSDYKSISYMSLIRISEKVYKNIAIFCSVYIHIHNSEYNSNQLVVRSIYENFLIVHQYSFEKCLYCNLIEE